MTQEEMLKRARELYECSSISDKLKNELESAFPELKESDDERIRKELIERFKWELKGAEEQDSAGCSRQKDISMFKRALAWLEKQGEPQDKGEISDGYHTFNELYYYRMLYNAAFFNMLPKEWVHKSKKHHDGEDCFGGGWFIVMANLPTGQISNHYELKDWNLFQIPEKEVADKWDGHTPQEAADRLHKYLLEKQDEQKPTEWSEEDERMLTRIINEIEAIKSNSSTIFEKNIAQEKIDWLKFLRPRHITYELDAPLGYDIDMNPIYPPISHWKPSQEQIRAVFDASERNDKLGSVLRNLYDDLRKL